MRTLLTLTLSLALLGSAAAARADDGPVVLDKWSRYHTNIVPYSQTLHPPKGKPVTWVPKVSLVIKVKDPESDDVVLLQHLKGRKKPWGKPQVCAIPSSGIIKRKGEGNDYSLVVLTCKMDDKMGSRHSGIYGVRVSYKQTARGKVHKDLATFHYQVKQYNHVWLAKKGPKKAFYIDHDFRMGEAWLYRRSDGRIQIWTWFKYDRAGSADVRGARLRCYNGDLKVPFIDNPTRRTEISYDHYTGNNKHRQTTWGLWYWFSPRTGDLPTAEFLAKNPGTYRCVMTQKGEIAREIYFTVGADGKIVAPPCQSAEGPNRVRLVSDEFLLGMKVQKRLGLGYDPGAFKKRPLYGRSWAKGCPPPAK